MNDTSSWLQQPTEPDDAYAAFARYRDLGRSRTMQRLVRELTQAKDIASAAMVADWAETYQWIARANAYDSAPPPPLAEVLDHQASVEVDARTARAIEQERRDARRVSRTTTAQKLQAAGDKLLEKALASLEQVDKLPIAEARKLLTNVARMIKDGAAMERLEEGLATQRSEHVTIDQSDPILQRLRASSAALLGRQDTPRVAGGQAVRDAAGGERPRGLCQLGVHHRSRRSNDPDGLSPGVVDDPAGGAKVSADSGAAGAREE